MSRHQKNDIERSERLAELAGEPSKVWQRKTVLTGSKQLEKLKEEQSIQEVLGNTVSVVEADVESRLPHEIALDEFIAIGRDKLKHNDMAISAANLIAAVKTKADIERTTKDRRLEMLKSMFAGAAPKTDEPSGAPR
jgi:hypothetical protein